MSDVPPSDPRDELASAYLDGEATPAEVAQVEADPDLLARVEALRLSSRAVATPVAPPPIDFRDQAIARAVDALEPTEPAPGTVDLSAERARRDRSRRGLWVASVAAALLAALVAAPLLARSFGGDGDTETAESGRAEEAVESAEGPPTTPDESVTDAGEGDSTEGESPEAAGGVGPADGFIGEFSNENSLIDAVRDASAAVGPSEDTGMQTNVLGPCPPSLGPTEVVVGVYGAILDGDAVTAAVIDDGSASRRVVVTTPDCALVAETDL